MRLLTRARQIGEKSGAVALLALTLGLLPASLSAQGASTRVYRDDRAWVEESQGVIAIPGGQQLIVRSERGRIGVDTTTASEVRYRIRKLAYRRSEEQARELFRDFDVFIRHTSSEVRVVGELVRRHSIHLANFSVEYEITVPANFRADVETQGGDIEVGDLGRSLRAVTAGGNIHTGDIGGDTIVETSGGSIRLGHIGGGLRARTAGGDIRVEGVGGAATLETSGGCIVSGQVQGTLRAVTAGGDIEIEGATGDVLARTAGGRIRVGEGGGRIRAETAGGSIHIVGAAGAVEAETAGGEIELERIHAGVRAATAAGNILARLLGDGKLASDSLLRTSFGDIEVYLPAELAVTIEATIEMATGNKIDTDFPLKIEGTSADFSFAAGPVRAFGDLNGGGQRLKIQTIGGDIVIRKLTERILEQQKRRMHLRERVKPRPRPARPQPEK